eukprot:m.234436 g.234436  ORF g.234436 m.234436 type:complete len:100 (-) comp43578_c0_seq1:241-540(-)
MTTAVTMPAVRYAHQEGVPLEGGPRFPPTDILMDECITARHENVPGTVYAAVTTAQNVESPNNVFSSEVADQRMHVVCAERTLHDHTVGCPWSTHVTRL